MNFLVDNSLCKSCFDIKNGTCVIINKHLLDFFPMAPLARLFFQQFSACIIFLGNCRIPSPPKKIIQM